MFFKPTSTVSTVLGYSYIGNMHMALMRYSDLKMYLKHTLRYKSELGS